MFGNVLLLSYFIIITGFAHGPLQSLHVSAEKVQRWWKIGVGVFPLFQLLTAKGLWVAGIALLVIAVGVGLWRFVLSCSPEDSGVKIGEYVVLVAQPDPKGGDVEDVAWRIVDDLKQLETLPFLHIRVREYPGTIRTLREAMDVAQAQAATVVVWGRSYARDFRDLTFEQQVIAGWNVGPLGELLEYPISAFLYMLSDQNSKALASIDKALVFNNQLVDLYLLRGLSYCRMGEYEIAAQAYSDGLALDPDFALLYLLRYDAYEALGEKDKAMEASAALQNDEQGQVWQYVLTLSGERRVCEFLIAP